MNLLPQPRTMRIQENAFYTLQSGLIVLDVPHPAELMPVARHLQDTIDAG